MRYLQAKQLHNLTLEINDFVLHMFNYTQNSRILNTHHVFEINKGIVHSYNFDFLVLERGPHNESSDSSKSIRTTQKLYPRCQEQADRERRSRENEHRRIYMSRNSPIDSDLDHLESVSLALSCGKGTSNSGSIRWKSHYRKKSNNTYVNFNRDGVVRLRIYPVTSTKFYCHVRWHSAKRRCGCAKAKPWSIPGADPWLAEIVIVRRSPDQGSWSAARKNVQLSSNKVNTSRLARPTVLRKIKRNIKYGTTKCGAFVFRQPRDLPCG